MHRRRSRIPVTTTAAVTLGLALLAGACSIPGDEKATPPDPSVDANAGGTVTVGVTTPGGIDPVNAFEPVGKLISSTMCDTLVDLDPDTGHLREGLAETVVTPDGNVFTFELRTGQRFNDGSRLTAADVEFSLQLLNARSTASHVRDLVAPFVQHIRGDDGVLADDIAGDAPMPITTGISDRAFQLMSEGPGFVRALTEPAFAPVSRAAYEADPHGFARNPVCVGPYRLEEPFTPGDTSLTLVRTPGYDGHNVAYTAGGDGYADRIVFRIYGEAGAAYAAYEAGDVDLVAVPPTKAADAERFGTALVTGPETSIELIGLPNEAQPFASLDVRRALSLALDRTALAATLGPANHAADGFLPSALELGSGDSAIRTSAVSAGASEGATYPGCGPAMPPTADPDAARAALDAARSSSPTLSQALDQPLTMYVNKDGAYPNLIRRVAEQWSDVLGLNVTVTPMPWDEYVDKATKTEGMDGAFHMAWATDASAPTPMFNEVSSFIAPIFLPAGESNWAQWRHGPFEYEVLESVGEVDPRERGLAFAAVEEILCEELPVLPIAFTRPQYLVRDTRLASTRAGFLHASTGLPLLREIYVR